MLDLIADTFPRTIAALRRKGLRRSDARERLLRRYLAMRAEQALQLYRVKEAAPVRFGGMGAARVRYEVRS